MTEKIDEYDTIIIGGGPAGISTWLHLNQMNSDLASKTLLIEKSKYPREKLCGGAVGGWSNLVFKQLEIDLEIPSIWIDNIECRFDDEIINLKVPKFFRMVQRAEFDHEFAKFAMKRGLEISEEEVFIEFKEKKEHLQVNTNFNKYNVKTLIGADGALSKVRKCMNLPSGSNIAPAIEIFEPVNPEFDLEFEEKKVVFDFTPIKKGLQGYVWHFPCIKNGKPYMNHGIGDFRIFKNQPRANMKEIFNRELQKRNIDRKIKTWASHPIRWLSTNDKLSQKYLFLIGDAAGIEPATGGGIHLALSYGELAAKTIVDAYKLNDFSYNDYNLRLKNHLVGKFIQKLTKIASDMYSLKINPLDAVKEIFFKK
jgi:flavin-dependent dehydrogenase